MTTLEQIDHRVTQIDTQVTQIDKRVAMVEAQIRHLATKADVANVKFDLLKWLVPIMLGQSAAIFATAKIWGD